MIKVNGNMEDIGEISLSDYLSGTDYEAKRIAVELNGSIVPKVQYADTILKDGDSVEIVSFVGGG